MKKYFLTFSIIISSCAQIQTTKNDYEEVINTLLKTELTGIDLLITDTEPVILDSVPGHNTISLDYLKYYSQRGFIKESDISYFVEQVKHSKSEKLDSNKFIIKTMTNDELNKMFSTLGYDSAITSLHKQKLKTIGSFSSPLFSKDNSVIIIWAMSWTNPLASQGYLFILKKVSNQWRIIENVVTFVS